MAARSRILWSPESEQDLLGIWQHVATEASPDTADRQLLLIDQSALTLRDWPLAGRVRNELHPGIRSLVAAPYVILYRVVTRDVQIVRVLHGRRDIDSIFSDTA